MEKDVPADDTERTLLSGRLSQPVSIGFAWALAVGMVIAGLATLRAGGTDAPLAGPLIFLPLLGVLWSWRWAVPLRRVVATRTGLLVTGPARPRFIPYGQVEAVRENRLSRLRPITVTLRSPVGGLGRFAFIPPRRRVGPNDGHPAAAELARRLEPSPQA